jgi:hypothetical protein
MTFDMLINIDVLDPLTSTAEERRAWVEEVQASAVKARSIAYENGHDDVHPLLDKYLDIKNPLNLIVVTGKMLDGEISVSDIINLNYLVSQSPGTQGQIGVRQVQRGS